MVWPGVAKNPQPILVDDLVVDDIFVFVVTEVEFTKLFLISHEYTDSATSSDVVVLMDSFKSKIISVKVKKRPGMEEEDVLSESGEVEDSGLWGSISR